MKDQINVNNDNREDDVKTKDGDNRGEDISESNITNEFDAILEDIKNYGKIIQLIIVNSQGSNINLKPTILKLSKAQENYCSRLWI